MKFTDKQKKKIIADYAECRNYSAVARKYKCSLNSVKNIVKANLEFAELCSEKAEDNRKDIMEYMSHQSDKVCRFFDRFLERLDTDDVNTLELDKLAKVFGIVFDKFCRPAQEVNLTTAEGIKVALEKRIQDWAE